MPTSIMSIVPFPVTSGSLEAKQLSLLVVGLMVQVAAMVWLVEPIVTRNRLGLLSGPSLIVALNVLEKMIIPVVVFEATTETVPVMMCVVAFAAIFVVTEMLMLSKIAWTSWTPCRAGLTMRILEIVGAPSLVTTVSTTL